MTVDLISIPFASVTIVGLLAFALVFAKLASYKVKKRQRDGELKRLVLGWCNIPACVRLLVATFAFWITMSAYLAQKQWLPTLEPTLYDEAIEALDRALHFGVLPSPGWHLAFPQQAWTQLIDFLYSLWYITKFPVAAYFIFNARKASTHYLLSLNLMWMICGWVTEWLPSLGPCYVQHVSQAPVGTTAARLQQSLWRGYEAMNANTDSTLLGSFDGVAAFPSLHVGVTALSVCFLWKLKRLRWVLLGYWALIQYGSAYLGWHYAVDGYVSSLIAVALYFIVKWLVDLIYGNQAKARVIS